MVCENRSSVLKNALYRKVVMVSSVFLSRLDLSCFRISNENFGRGRIRAPIRTGFLDGSVEC